MNENTPDFNQNNTPKRPEWVSHAFLQGYVLLNGICVGQSVSAVRHMVDNGYDKNAMLVLLLCLGPIVISAKRSVEIWKDLYRNNKQNQK